MQREAMGAGEKLKLTKNKLHQNCLPSSSVKMLQRTKTGCPQVQCEQILEELLVRQLLQNGSQCERAVSQMFKGQWCAESTCMYSTSSGVGETARSLGYY